MIKLLSIIGARPQIIKSAAISRAIHLHYGSVIQDVLVHTGQHYDTNMSAVFFDELQIPQPAYNLEVGSSSHSKQTADMLLGIEAVLTKEKPHAILVYGDTNSTLAGSLVAAKMKIPLVHIEAGLRSYNKYMPEEINRICCDHCSTYLFAPTQTAYDNLLKEGFQENTKSPYHISNPKIFRSGDLMYDNSVYFSSQAEKRSTVLEKFGLAKGHFILATVHRDHNTDVPERLQELFSAFLALQEQSSLPVLLPLHPRTKKSVENLLPKELYTKINNCKKIIICEPLSFLDMTCLEMNCKLVVTDSGGVQKEAYYFEKPCIILRPETEWVELLESGAAILTDVQPERILHAYRCLSEKKSSFPAIFGDGHTAEFICEALLKNLY